jgi:LysM repeat protein
MQALFAVLAVLVPAVSPAQDEAGAGGRPAGQEALRQAVELQSRKIDQLSREVARLSALIEKGRPADTAREPAQGAAPAVETHPEGQEVRRAEPAAASGPGHVVAKGETLTSIARQYNVSVADLLQANKIVDDRKLQIGQTLLIPVKTETSENPQKPTGGN